MNKIDVTCLFRKRGARFSIEKVFGTIIAGLRKRHVDVRCAEVPCGDASFRSLFRNLLYCFRNLRGKFVHITGDVNYCALALKRNEYIVTIHDLVLMERKNRLARLVFLWFWYKLPCRRAGCVVCISEKTKEELIRFCGPLRVPIYVVPDPIDASFVCSPKEFDHRRPVILQVGTKENKNLFRVVDAVKHIPCVLRIIGRLNPKQEEYLRVSAVEYSSAHELSDRQVVDEYKRADVVCFPSLYEGFGMPIIEAQATGRVVVTSNISPMAEIAGETACLVDPYSVESIRDGLRKVISDDPYRERLIAAGLENVRKYSSDEIVAQYMKLYAEFGAECSRPVASA